MPPKKAKKEDGAVETSSSAAVKPKKAVKKKVAEVTNNGDSPKNDSPAKKKAAASATSPKKAEAKPKVVKKRKVSDPEPDDGTSSPTKKQKVLVSKTKAAAEKKPRARKGESVPKEKKPRAKKGDESVANEKKTKKTLVPEAADVGDLEMANNVQTKVKSPKKETKVNVPKTKSPKKEKETKVKSPKKETEAKVPKEKKPKAEKVPKEKKPKKEKAEKPPKEVKEKPEKPADDDADLPIVKHKKGFFPKPMAAAQLLKKVVQKRYPKKPQVAAKTTDPHSEEASDGEKVGADEEEATDSGDSKPKSVLLNKSTTNWDNVDLRIEGDFKLKIASWNVSGLRAWLQKGGNEYMTQERPDIICLQETKCKTEDIPETAHLWGYHPYWLGFGGYAGVATYSRQMPINVTYGIGDEELDEEPRLMTLEYEKFFLINVYVPNSGRKLVTLPKRLRWNKLFHLYVLLLDKKKPVIICGDLNVAHAEIDLKNPKSNTKNAGFTKEERDGMTQFLDSGFLDTFRYLYPEQEGAYTFWTYMGNARAKNVGWRLDYILISERISKNLVDHKIRSAVYGSDHCPIVGFFNL